MTETFYDLLGVPEDASTAAIEDAYRDEIKQVHPDVSDDVDASERTKRLNKAKRVLTDEEERTRYDRQGHESYVSGGASDTAPGPKTTSDPWPGHDGRRGSGQGRSVGSTGPSWQSSRADRASASAAGGAEGPSARRQAAAGTTSGPNTDWSWNAWEQTRSWAVRQGRSDGRGIDPEQFVPTQQSVILLVSTFFLYPFFVASALFPPFPMVARLLVATCTLLMFAYLLSVPEIAVTVFGIWSLLAPIALVVLPGVGLFSVAGVVTLSVTWIPCALSVLTLSVLET